MGGGEIYTSKTVMYASAGIAGYTHVAPLWY